MDACIFQSLEITYYIKIQSNTKKAYLLRNNIPSLMNSTWSSRYCGMGGGGKREIWKRTCYLDSNFKFNIQCMDTIQATWCRFLTK